jgi:hypothetical protein
MKDSENTILYDRLAPVGGLGLQGLGLTAGTPAAPPRATGFEGDARYKLKTTPSPDDYHCPLL